MNADIQVITEESLDNVTTYVLREQGDWYEEEIRFLRLLLLEDMSVLDYGLDHDLYALSSAKSVSSNGKVVYLSTNENLEYTQSSVQLNSFNKFFEFIGNDYTETSNQQFDFMRFSRNTNQLISNFSDSIKSHLPIIMTEAIFENDSDLIWLGQLGYNLYRLRPSHNLLIPLGDNFLFPDFNKQVFLIPENKIDVLFDRGFLVKELLPLKTINKENTAGFDWLSKKAYVTEQQINLYQQIYRPGISKNTDRFIQIFNAYALSHDTNLTPDERYGHLCTALSSLKDIKNLDQSPHLLSTYARLSFEFGQYKEALDALTKLWKNIINNGFCPTSLFLLPTEKYEKNNQPILVSDWLGVQTIEQAYFLQFPSSYFDISNEIETLIGNLKDANLSSDFLNNMNQLSCKRKNKLFLNIVPHNSTSSFSLSNKPKYTPQIMEPVTSLKVTVCVATYNRCNLLIRTIDSVLNQTYTNFELLICDDTSTDDTETYCTNLALLDHRIKYYRNDNNLGMVANYQKMYDMVETELFVICSDDDFLLPRHLERTVDAFNKQPGLGMVFGQTICGSVNGTGQVSIIPKNLSQDGIVDPKKMLFDSIMGNNICWTSALIRKTAVDRMATYGKDNLEMSFEDIFIKEGDYFFVLLMLVCAPVAFVNVPASYFSVDGSSYSTTQLGGGWGMEIRLRTVYFLHQLYIDNYGDNEEEKNRISEMLVEFDQMYAQIENKLSADEKIEHSKKLNEFQSMIKQLKNLTQNIEKITL